MFKRKTNLLYTAGLACITIAPYAANAQHSNERRQLEEIVVTAQQREERLQDVPLSIVAFSADTLKNQGIENVEGLAQLSPSLGFDDRGQPSSNTVRIRGVGTDITSPAVESGVSIVLDGVPLARNDLANFDFADIQRIEILRGPQGTLFGKNSTAGVINIVTAEPTEEFTAFVRGSYDEPSDWPGSEFKTQFGLSGPLTDTLGARLTGFYKETDGQFEDVLQNQTTPHNESWGARGKLHWHANEDVLVRLTMEYQKTDGQFSPFTWQGSSPSRQAADPAIIYTRENRKTRSFGNNLNEIDNKAASLTVDWDLGAVTLTSITGWRNFENSVGLDIPKLFAGSPLALDIVNSSNTRTFKTFTQELRLTSNGEGAVDYTVGALWYENDIKQTLDGIGGSLFTYTDSLVPLIAGPFGLGGLPITSIENFQGRPTGLIAEGQNKNLGIYAQGTWHMTDKWDLTAGLRYIDEQLTGHSYDATQETYDFYIGSQLVTSFTLPVSIDEQRGSIDDNDVTGALALQYDWDGHTRLYGRLSTGYKGGAIDLTGPPTDAYADPIKPETVVNFELGSKSRLFDNRLSLDISLFQSTFKDFQTPIVNTDGTSPNFGSVTTANAGKLQVRGIEIDASAQVTDSLFVSASVLYNDSQYKEFDAPCFKGQLPGENGGVDSDNNDSCDFQDNSGKSLASAPEYAATMLARYEVPMADGQAHAQLSGRWQDEVNFTSTHNPNTIQEAYSVWDLRVGWTGLEDRLELTFYVKNLFDKFYYANLTEFTAGLVADRRDVNGYFPSGANRSFGVSAGYSF